jgi:hypothetical protein
MSTQPTHLPSAFVVPHTDGRTKLWVTSPNGHFMLLSGSWLFIETAKLFATRCGYNIIATDLGLAIVEQQSDLRSRAATPSDRVH